MWFFCILGGIVVIVLFCWIKDVVWNKPHKTIDSLKNDLETLQALHKKEIVQLQNRLNNSNSLHVQESEFSDIVATFALKELSDLCNKEYAFLGIPTTYSFNTKNL